MYKRPHVNPEMLLLLENKTKQNTKNISNTQQDIDVRKDFFLNRMPFTQESRSEIVK